MRGGGAGEGGNGVHAKGVDAGRCFARVVSSLYLEVQGGSRTWRYRGVRINYCRFLVSASMTVVIVQL